MNNGSAISAQSAHVILSDEEVKTLTQAGIIPENTPKAQIQVFARICKERGLSAFSKEIYLVGYGGKFSTIVGINGFRKIAAESGQHAGTDDVKYDIRPDGSYSTAFDLRLAGKVPQTATVTVYRIISGQRVPFTHTAVFTEFAGTSGKWREMPFQMIGKVAEAFALRKGFADRTAGLEIEEEMDATNGQTMNAAKLRIESALAEEDLAALKSALAKCQTIEALNALYQSNMTVGAAYVDLFTERKNEIISAQQ
jgi:phage recombination protein Bet